MISESLMMFAASVCLAATPPTMAPKAQEYAFASEHGGDASAVPSASQPQHWYQKLSVTAFADAYANYNFNFPNPSAGAHNSLRAFDLTNGFAIHWGGLDISYDGGTIGVALSLRFGPGAQAYGIGIPDNVGGGFGQASLEVAKQAYVTWKPSDTVSIDFGKFDTIYGAEVAETQNNFNYTAGIVFNNLQPFFHTGFRVNVTLSEQAGLTFLLVNGVDSVIDNNTGKSVGAQFSLASGPFELYVGGLIGPEVDDVVGGVAVDDINDKFEILLDVVVKYAASEALQFVVNGDFLTSTRDNTEEQWGVMAAGRFGVNENVGVAVRGEVARGLLTAGGALGTVMSGTVTLDYQPVPGQIFIRLEPRIDVATGDNKDMFPTDDGATSTAFTTTLGMVVTTN